MAANGSPTLHTSAAGMRICIVASSWHDAIMDGLIGGARRRLEQLGAAQVDIIRVPGSFELPLGAQAAIAAGADAVVALGVVIRGGTPHFDYVCQAATAGLTRVALDAATPVGFGVLTCDNEAQALDRAGLEGSHEDKGAEAAEAAVAMVGITRLHRGGPGLSTGFSAGR